MSTTQVRIKDAAAEFLALRRIAVTGVSANPKGHGSNVVYQRLRERGYDVFAVNPNAGTVEGDRAYASLRDIPGGVEGVVIATAAERAPDAMREIIELGVGHVWMHRAFGAGQRLRRSDRTGPRGRDHRHRRRVPADVRRALGRWPPAHVPTAHADREGPADRLIARDDPPRIALGQRPCPRFSRIRSVIRTGVPTKPKSSRSRRSTNRR